MTGAAGRIFALALAGVLLSLASFNAGAQSAARSSTSEQWSYHEKWSYMTGTRLGASMAQTLPRLGIKVDLNGVEKALAHSFNPGGTLLDASEIAAMDAALEQRGQGRVPAPGAGADLIADEWKLGLYFGTGIVNTVQRFRDVIDVPLLMQGLRTSLAGGKLAMTDAELVAAQESLQQYVDELDATGGW